MVLFVTFSTRHCAGFVVLEPRNVKARYRESRFPARQWITDRRDLDGRAVLVFNPCDGWHDGFVRASEEDGEVYHVGIYPWMGSEMLPHDF